MSVAERVVITSIASERGASGEPAERQLLKGYKREP